MLGDLAIVTFFSDYSNQGKGFLMFYEAFTNGSSATVGFSTNIILSETPSANLTYPGDNSNYSNYELSTFVYSPNFSQRDLYTIQADYVLNSMEGGNCFDFVTVYRFVPVADINGTGWSYVDK
jgi:hypothetical protein